MTQAVGDADELTSMLAEKEKDLELAARIGQSLLEQNRELLQRNEFLDEQLVASSEHVGQLKAQLQRKVDLLRLCADSERADTSGASTPALERRPPSAPSLDQPAAVHARCRLLEEENASLRLEAASLRHQTQEFEEKEQRLVTDCVQQLEVANERIESLQQELEEKSGVCTSHHKEITKLLKEIVQLQGRERNLAAENGELSDRLLMAQETQSQLTSVVVDLQERYAEVLAILNEAQHELKLYRRRPTPYRPASPDSFYGSLASEMEASDSSIHSTPLVSARGDSDASVQCGPSARLAAKTVATRLSAVFRACEPIAEDDALSLRLDALRTPSPVACSSPTVASLLQSPPPPPSSAAVASPPSAAHLSRASSADSLAAYQGPGVGVPGNPGTPDLEFALRRARRSRETQYARFCRSRSYRTLPERVAPLPPPPLVATTRSFDCVDYRLGLASLTADAALSDDSGTESRHEYSDAALGSPKIDSSLAATLRQRPPQAAHGGGQPTDEATPLQPPMAVIMDGSKRLQAPTAQGSGLQGILGLHNVGGMSVDNKCIVTRSHLYNVRRSLSDEK